MTRRLVALAFLSGALLLLALMPCGALVGIGDTGTWPDDWPTELDPLRARAQTIEVATGLQMNIYQISFVDREEFEGVWSAILSVKSKGGTLTLYALESEAPGWPTLSNEAPCVRIYAPSGGILRSPPPEGAPEEDPVATRTYDEMQKLVGEGKALNAAPPWPESAQLWNGELPEYVVAEWIDGRMTWVPADTEGEPGGFLHRARVDIELVVDGDVVDLNRLHLPADTPIVDRRRLLEE